MKVLAFSDLHRDTAAAQHIVDSSSDADILIGAGDFATFGIGATDTLDILKTCTCPVIIVHGNHDDPETLRTFCADWENGHYLQGAAIKIGGHTIFGLGGEIPSRNTAPWNSSHTETDAAQMLETCPAGAILVTHTPPHGVADVQTDGTQEGSVAIHDAAQRLQPDLLLCGHIHAAWGMCGQIGPTKVHNLGPNPNWFELT